MTDSHFGQLVPLGFLRLWKVFATCSGLQELGSPYLAYPKQDWKLRKGKKRKFKPDNDDSESSDIEEKEDMTPKKKQLKNVNSASFFLKKLRVWRRRVRPGFGNLPFN